MTLQAFGGSLDYPFGYQFGREPFLLDGAISASAYVAYILRVPKTGTISKVSTFFGPGANPGGTSDWRLETIDDTTGFPTGTLFGASTNKTRACTGADINTMVTIALIAGASVSQGQELALVVRGGSGATGRISSFSGVMATGGYSQGYPYRDDNGYIAAAMPILALEYSDGICYPVDGCLSLQSVGVNSYLSTDTPDEVGIIFQVPFKTRVRGFGMVGFPAAGSTFTGTLYGSDGTTVLTSVTPDNDNRAVGPSTGYNTNRYTFPASQTLMIDTNYRLTVKPNSATIPLAIYDFGVKSAAYMDALPGGQKVHKTQRTDAGAWTETTTNRPLVWPLIDAFDDAVSVGGESAMVFSG